jgi:hypothetical protein
MASPAGAVDATTTHASANDATITTSTGSTTPPAKGKEEEDENDKEKEKEKDSSSLLDVSKGSSSLSSEQESDLLSSLDDDDVEEKEVFSDEDLIAAGVKWGLSSEFLLNERARAKAIRDSPDWATMTRTQRFESYYIGNTVVEAKVDQVETWTQLRKINTNEAMHLTESMIRYGVLATNPTVACLGIGGDSRLKLVDGAHRFKAAKILIDSKGEGMEDFTTDKLKVITRHDTTFILCYIQY